MSVSRVQAANVFPPLALSGAAKAAQTSTSSGSTSTDGGLTSTTTGTTFLNLLVQELQNQDPTAPMDSTAMVGQMISLNQLDQLISINQVLSTASSGSTSATPTTGAGSSPTSSAQLIAQHAALLNPGPSLSSLSSGNAASDPNSTLDFSSMNIPYGGK